MSKPLVSIVMGSANDWDIMQQAAQQLKDFGVEFDARVISAHRSPDLLFDYIKQMAAGGVQCFIAGAGGAAHLAGVIAGKTTLPVLGVPIPSKYLKGMDSLLSIVQMPKGIPVATFAIGEAGAANAGLFAVAMLALHDQAIAGKLAAYRKKQAEQIAATTLPSLS
jgi:5-(carboxyamino)imidazole ribonucleotide mutase